MTPDEIAVLKSEQERSSILEKELNEAIRCHINVRKELNNIIDQLKKDNKMLARALTEINIRAEDIYKNSSEFQMKSFSYDVIRIISKAINQCGMIP